MTAVLAANYSAPISSVAGTVTIGQCLVSSGSAGYVVGTSANRTTYGRCDGIAITSGDQRTPVVMIEVGPIPASMTGLGTGLASPLRVSAAGALERVTTPSGSDEVVGYCETDGRAHVLFGVLTHRVFVDSGGGGGTPGGSSGDVQVNNAGAFAGVAPSTSGFVLTSNGSAWVSAAAAFPTSGTLAHERGGLEADVSAFNGFVSISGGSTTAITPGAGVATWFATPSGANLASALTTALPDSKGGTGLTALGSGVATLLGTFSAANLASALGAGDITGTGDVVLQSSPSLTSPTITGSVQIGATPYASAGAVRLGSEEGIFARDAGDTADIQIAECDASNDLYIGDDAGNTKSARFTHVRGNAGVRLGYGGVVALAIDGSDDFQIRNPIVGYTAANSPYGCHGVGSLDMADADQTAPASVYSFHTIKTTGAITGNRTLTLPAATDAKAYTKIINNTCSGAFSIVVAHDGGAATTITVANARSAIVLVDSRGVTRITPDTVLT